MMWRKRTALAGLVAVALARTGMAAPVCDGRHDATAALNAMLAAGGQVRLPAGVCLVSATVVVRSDTRLAGAGREATIIRSVLGATYPTLSVGQPRSPQEAHEVDVSALTVDGGAAARGPRSSDGILITGPSSRVRIHDVAVLNAGDNGIEANGSDIDVTDSLVHDNWTNGIYVIGTPGRGAIPARRATRIRIIQNQVIHNSLGGLPPSPKQTWDGIDVDPITSDVLVQDNVVTGNDIIFLESARSVASSGPFRAINNVVTDSTENGIDLTGAIVGFEVSGNRIERVLGWGIVVNGPARQGVIRGNMVQGTTREGIEIHNAMAMPSVPSDILVTGNTVTPGPGAHARAAIGVDQGASAVRVIGNRLILHPGIAALDTHGAGPGLVGTEQSIGVSFNVRGAFG